MERRHLAGIGRQAKTSNENRRKQLGKTTRPVVEGQSCLAVGKPSTPAPAGWEWRKLTEIARLESGHTPSKSKSAYWNGDFAWIGISDARQYDGDVIDDTEKHITQAGLDNSSARLLPPRTVCLSRTASIGYCVIMGREMATSQDFINWVCSDELYPEFLQYVFRAEHDALLRFGEGSTHQTIYFKDAKRFHVCVPDVPTQKRIVARLDSLLARREKAEHYLTAIPPLIDQFRQSVLARAFTGELTADWRKNHPDVEPASELLERIKVERREKWIENYARKLADRARKRNEKKGKKFTDEDWQAYFDKKVKVGAKKYEKPEAVDPEAERLPEIPETWEWVRLEDLIADIQAGKSPSAGSRPAKADEHGVLKVSALSWGKFLPQENKVLPADYKIRPRTLVREGDLLFSRANTTELVGAVVLVRDEYPNLMLSDKTLRLVPASKQVNLEVLLYALRTPEVRDYFEARATGTSDSMRNLSQDKIMGAPIALPPLAEQQKLVQLLADASGFIQSTETNVSDLVGDLERLNSSMLAGALSGAE